MQQKDTAAERRRGAFLALGIHALLLLGVGAVLFQPRLGWANLAFYAAIYCALLSAALLSSRAGRSLWLQVPVAAAFTLFATLWWSVLVLHGDNRAAYGPLAEDTARAFFQTDLRETVSYVGLYSSPFDRWWEPVWLTLLIGSSLWLQWVSRRSRPGRGFAVALVTPPIVLALVASVTRPEAFLLADQARRYGEVLREYAASRSELRQQDWIGGLSSEFDGSLVVVLGESTARQHLGIYGYPRDTTPALQARRDELVVLTDAISTHSHTIESLGDALTLNDRHRRREIHEVLDLVSVLQEAGFRVVWLSNQNAVGVWDNYVSAMARQSDLVRFHDTASGGEFLRSSFDGEMLATLGELLEETGGRKTVFFLHMMATHFPYCGVVPEDFEDRRGERFGQAIDGSLLGDLLLAPAPRGILPRRIGGHLAQINCYDGAVRYLDHFLDRLYELLEGRTESAVTLYTADHGEAPLLGTGHDSRLHSHFHVEVPVLLWANPSYRSSHPDRWRSLRSVRDRPVSLVDLSFSLLDLAQVEGVPELERRSWISEAYSPFDRTTLHGAVGYDSSVAEGVSRSGDPSEMARANLTALRRRHGEVIADKVWAHRVNTSGALLEAKEVFAGVELDVVYDERTGRFHVVHPPASDVGLTLDAYLRQDDGRIRYWLDWKNAAAGNLDDGIDRLAEHDALHELGGRLVVETQQGFASTPRIAAQGWTSSYYLPTDELLELVRSGDRRELERAAAAVGDSVVGSGYTAVSFDARLYSFFDQWLRPLVEANALDVYVWAHWIRTDREGLVAQVERYVVDPSIEALLVDFPSNFDH